MASINQFFYITKQVVFVTVFVFFSTLNAKNFDKFSQAGSISDYFSGVLHLSENEYELSYQYLKKLDGLETNHNSYSTKYLYSLVNSGNLDRAFNFSKKIENKGLSSFESDLISGIYFLKNNNLSDANKYFLKAKRRKVDSVLSNYIIESLLIWSNIQNFNLNDKDFIMNKLDNRFGNLKKIQNVFLNCFFESNQTEILFEKLINDQTDFSRYNFFYAQYLDSVGKRGKAKKIIEASLVENPRNLILNQLKYDFDNSKKNLSFDCKKQKHISAELLYITANALSSQSVYPLSNFYLNLSKYLNENFHTFDTLFAQNFYSIGDYSNAKKIYKRFTKYGNIFKWHADKQIARILILENEKQKSFKLLANSFKNLKYKTVYEIFDYAEFLKNNEKFEESIKLYSEVLTKIDKQHQLYPEATDGRGVSYERIGEWEKAEIDLLASLNASPNQAYVINYLAYSWIEQGVKIEKSLSMLKKANEIKSNDPYIIDSLGWALFKLKRYKESKRYLQNAVQLLPADPIVNDHYGDVLWKNGKKIQARYYWDYVLKLDETDKQLKDKIKQKLIRGL